MSKTLDVAANGAEERLPIGELTMLSDRLSRMLTAYVDGELNEQQQETIQHLLRQSPDARKLLRNLQTDAGLLRAMPQRSVGQDLVEPVLERIAGKTIRPARRSLTLQTTRMPAWFGLATAAAVLFLVGLGSYLYFVAAKAKTDAASQLALEHPRETVPIPNSRVTPSEPDPVIPNPEDFLDSPTKRDLASVPSPKDRGSEELPFPAKVLARSDKPEVLPPAPSKDEPGKDRLEDVYTVPVQPLEPFRKPDINIALILKLRDIEVEKRREELAEELHRGTAHLLDLGCQDTAVAIERVQAAFEKHGISLLIDQDAQDRLKLRFRTNYALYTENVTPQEVLSILRQLRGEDLKAETRRRGTSQFGMMTVDAMTEEDFKTFAKVIGTDSRLDKPPRAKAHTALDIRKPLSSGTEEQVVKALKGQGGTPRPQPDKPVIKPSDRIALVVAYNPIRPRPASAEVKLFLENRKEQRSGTMQMLLVLRGPK